MLVEQMPASMAMLIILTLHRLITTVLLMLLVGLSTLQSYVIHITPTGTNIIAATYKCCPLRASHL